MEINEVKEKNQILLNENIQMRNHYGIPEEFG